MDKNVDEAVKWFALAAEQGNPYAQFNLAELYASGSSVKRDLQRAFSLYSLAGKTLDVSEQLRQISSLLKQDEPTASPQAASQQ